MRFVPEIKAYPPPVQSIVQLQRKVKVWREPVNDKEKVANQIREQIRSGDEPTVQTLLSWARMLEQSEQQTPQSPDGRDCSGESSVQPVAVLVGNVVRRSDGRKIVVRRNRNLEPGESFVSESAHDDGDYSYVCGRDWCRCMQ